MEADVDRPRKIAVGDARKASIDLPQRYQSRTEKRHPFVRVDVSGKMGKKMTLQKIQGDRTKKCNTSNEAQPEHVPLEQEASKDCPPQGKLTVKHRQ